MIFCRAKGAIKIFNVLLQSDQNDARQNLKRRLKEDRENSVNKRLQIEIRKERVT